MSVGIGDDVASERTSAVRRIFVINPKIINDKEFCHISILLKDNQLSSDIQVLYASIGEIPQGGPHFSFYKTYFITFKKTETRSYSQLVRSCKVA